MFLHKEILMNTQVNIFNSTADKCMPMCCMMMCCMHTSAGSGNAVNF